MVFLLTTKKRLPPGAATRSLLERLSPLKDIRVWRFGLYYFFVFGGFVALAQWLVPYYVNAYGTTVAVAGLLATCNSLPSGIIRAVGGWMSDKFGAPERDVLGAGTFADVLSAVDRSANGYPLSR